MKFFPNSNNYKHSGKRDDEFYDDFYLIKNKNLMNKDELIKEKKC